MAGESRMARLSSDAVQVLPRNMEGIRNYLKICCFCFLKEGREGRKEVGAGRRRGGQGRAEGRAEGRRGGERERDKEKYEKTSKQASKNLKK